MSNNLFGLKEDNPSQRNCQNQECQESKIQGKIHIQQNWNEGLEYYL